MLLQKIVVQKKKSSVEFIVVKNTRYFKVLASFVVTIALLRDKFDKRKRRRAFLSSNILLITREIKF